MDNKNYNNEYNEGKFFEKIMKFAKMFGAKTIYYALLLFYVLQEPGVPLGAKTRIISALGYFIVPFDIVPDAIPVAGQADDAMALSTALLTVSFWITSNVKDRARQKMVDFFGKGVLTALDGYDKEIQ